MTTVTLTSKGQLTLPVSVRRALGLGVSDKLQVSVNADTRTITLQQPMTVDDFSKFAAAMPRKKIRPVVDASAYYSQHREAAGE